nr:hypothetical protein [Frigoriglobus tundricola]
MCLTLIVAETIAASSGIGYMAMNAREFLLTDVVVLSIPLHALLGRLADLAAPGTVVTAVAPRVRAPGGRGGAPGRPRRSRSPACGARSGRPSF